MKSHLLTACLCLLVGAVVNVLVAWGCAVWSPPRRTVLSNENVRGAAWPISVPSDWPTGPRTLYRHAGLGNTWNWAGASVPLGRPGSEWPDRRLYWVADASFGLPMRSMAWRSVSPPFSRYDHVLFRGVPTPTWLRPHGEASRWLPLMPISLGTLVNTAFYGAVMWAALVEVPAARRALRRHRGLCPACAYNLRGIAPEQPCPECGYV